MQNLAAEPVTIKDVRIRVRVRVRGLGLGLGLGLGFKVRTLTPAITPSLTLTVH